MGEGHPVCFEFKDKVTCQRSTVGRIRKQLVLGLFGSKAFMEMEQRNAWVKTDASKTELDKRCVGHKWASTSNAVVFSEQDWWVAAALSVEAKSLDGKTLPGSVMNTKFMMEFTNSPSSLSKFMPCLCQIQRDERPILCFKISFFARAHNFSLATFATQIFSDLVTPDVMVATVSNFLFCVSPPWHLILSARQTFSHVN